LTLELYLDILSLKIALLMLFVAAF